MVADSPNGPFDCSNAVSHLLQVGGFGNPTMDTTQLVRWGEPGPGQWVTIFVKPYGADAHTFIRFSAGVTPPGERYTHMPPGELERARKQLDEFLAERSAEALDSVRGR